LALLIEDIGMLDIEDDMPMLLDIIICFIMSSCICIHVLSDGSASQPRLCM